MKEISSQIEFVEDRPDHHYRTEIPNFLFDILDPQMLAIYCHLKRICGDGGRCWMSMKNLAKKIGISETTLRGNLSNMSVENHLVAGSLIEIIKRKKPDGSSDSNIIRIVDVWRLNGDHYRSQNINRGTSPITPPPPQNLNQGGSPFDDKEQPSQEEPFEENNKQPVVVVSSENEYKKKILEPYRLGGKLVDQFLNLSVAHLVDAIAAFEQYKSAKEAQGDKIDNPVGALRNAIVGAWKPNVTKADKEKEKIRKMTNDENFRKKNYQIALELYDQYSCHFHENFRFDVSDNVVSLKYKQGRFFPLPLSDDAFENILDYYINSNMKK